KCSASSGPVGFFLPRIGSSSLDGETAQPRGGRNDPLDPRHQLLDSYRQRRGEFDQRVRSRETLSNLDEADVGPVDGGECAEFFLREPGATAGREHVAA